MNHTSALLLLLVSLASLPEVSGQLSFLSAFFNLFGCGGENQRACCVNESFPSCNSGLLEDFDAVCTDTLFLGFLTCRCGFGIPPSLSVFSAATSTGICKDPQCGGNGERACCVAELPFLARSASCDSGLCETGLLGLACNLDFRSCNDVLGSSSCGCLVGGGSSSGICRTAT